MDPADCVWGHSVIPGAAGPLTRCNSGLLATAEGLLNSGSAGVLATKHKAVSESRKTWGAEGPGPDQAPVVGGGCLLVPLLTKVPFSSCSRTS